MRPGLLALAIVMLPLVALSVLQMGLPVLAPVLVAHAGLAPEAVGIIGGCLGLGSVWMFAANPRITPVLGPLRALVAACFLAVVGTALVLIGSPISIFPGAILIGFAYAVTAPAGSQILSAHAPPRHWGTLFSIRQAGVPLGGAIAGIVGIGLTVAYGWRVGLACLALIPLGTIALLLIAPQSYWGGASGAVFRLRDLIRPALIASPFQTLRDMPQLRPLTLSSLGFAAVQSSMFSFMTTYLTVGLGLGLPLAGSLFATMQITSFAGRLGVGVVADRMGGFRPLLLAMAIAGAASCIVMGMVDPAWPEPALFLIAGLTGLAAATWNGLFLAEIARIVPPEAVSQATAGTTFFTFVGYMVTPPIFALIVLIAGYQAAYGVAAAAAVFGFVCLLPLRSDPGSRFGAG